MNARDEQSGLVFISDGCADAGIEICVNFGPFAGRDVTEWEIERLRPWLLDEVDALTVISEHRHQIGKTGGAAIHQVRIEIANENTPEEDADRRELEGRLLERLDYWARSCFADRRTGIEDS